MKASEYRAMSVEQLRAREDELRKSNFNLRTRAATKELENVLRIKDEKHELARLLTVINEKVKA